jgi:hypothetical protein
MLAPESDCWHGDQEKSCCCADGEDERRASLREAVKKFLVEHLVNR